jgi:general secretion pathway protein G
LKKTLANTPPVCLGRAALRRGFTLTELLITIAIILTVAALAVPAVVQSLYSAKVSRATGDILTLQAEIDMYRSNNGALPNTLADMGVPIPVDPWGNAYQYLVFTSTNKGKQRKDKFLVPLNTTYDLYSMGRDGQSVPPLTAKASQDDIVRAEDGGFVGLASTF